MRRECFQDDATCINLVLEVIQGIVKPRCVDQGGVTTPKGEQKKKKTIN